MMKIKIIILGIAVIIVILCFAGSVFEPAQLQNRNKSCKHVVSNITNLADLNYSSSNKTEIVLLSNGSTIEQCFINSNTYNIRPVYMTNMPNNIFQGIYPSIDNKKNLYFEKTYYDSKPNICCINVTNLSKAPIEEIVQGLIPSINLNGTYLMYILCKAYTNITLNIFNINKEKVILTISDLHAKHYYNYVWLNNDEFVYCAKNLNIKKYNIITKETTEFEIPKNIFPCQLSPDRKKLLCINEKYNKIYIYDIEKQILKMQVNKKICSSFVWSPTSKGFFYSRQPEFKLRYLLSLTDLVMFGEKRNLYYRDIYGKEIMVKEHFSLFGGAWLKKNKK